MYIEKFYDYLLSQKLRDDPVGDLAKDIILYNSRRPLFGVVKKEFPQKDPGTISDFLFVLGASESCFDAFETAKEEYINQNNTL